MNPETYTYHLFYRGSIGQWISVPSGKLSNLYSNQFTTVLETHLHNLMKNNPDCNPRPHWMVMRENSSEGFVVREFDIQKLNMPFQITERTKID